MIGERQVLAADGVTDVARDGDVVRVVVQFRPLGRKLPRRLGHARSVTATLEDANHTKLTVRGVHAQGDRLHVAVAGVGPTQQFRLRFAGLPRGSDSVVVSQLDDPAFDPAQPPAPREPAASRTLADYLAKDFRSFKRLMLDSISHQLPGFVERHEADTTIALIEVLAFAADNLSYYQDAVATEAYLETARRRISVRRHARLIGYQLSEGCTPRVWLHVAPKPDTAFMFERSAGYRVSTDTGSTDTQRVFEPLANVWLDSTVTTMQLWDGAAAPALGATSAVVVRSRPAPAPAGVAALERGTVLIFEEGPDPVTRMPGSRRNRQAVRLDADPLDLEQHPTDAAKVLTLIAWSEDDALTFAPQARTAIVRGNIVPADFGATTEMLALPPEAFCDETATLRVPLRDVTFAVPYANDQPAKAFTELDPRDAVPALEVTATSYDQRMTWRARRDLIAADAFDPAFAVEVDRNGTLLLRFGDGVNGWRPDSSSRFTLRYRQGSGIDGHVGANTLTELAVRDERIDSITNPLPSAGGQLPEDIAKAKRRAPDDIRVQRRCIADADYLAVAQSFPGVSAFARRRWTGDRSTVEVYVHAKGDEPKLRDRVRAALAAKRLIGTDVVVRPPQRVPVAVKLQIEYVAGAHPQDVAHQVAGSVKAVLDEQNSTLGPTLFASPLIVAAKDVPAVTDAKLVTFARLNASGATGDDYIALGPTELAVFVDEDGMATNGLPLVEIVAQR